MTIRIKLSGDLSEINSFAKSKPALGCANDHKCAQRAAALNFATASVGLEGFKSSALDADLSRKYEAGEISISDAIQAINEYAQER